MTQTSRSAVTLAPGRLELRTVETPSPSPGRAVVRVEAVGLCGSDYHIFDGTHPYAVFPQVQGHEMAGVVAALPADGGGPLAVGDRVVVNPLRGCGHCFPCRRGRPNCCVDVTVMGVQIPGGLADHVAVPLGQLVPAGDLPARVAVLSEPVAIGLHAVGRGGVAPGDDVVVLGAGPIGLAAVLAAADRGARVLAADRIAVRLDLARRAGAARVVDARAEDLAAAVAGFTRGAGAAVVIEATGVPALLRLAVDVVAHSGTVVAVGISTAEVALTVSDLSRKELNLLGSRNSAGEFPAAVDLVTRRAGVVADWVTHEFGLTEVAAAIRFAVANPHEAEKVVISCLLE
ncbi:zinc-binding dehydrogenase [Dactylosporangium matsuzakiense]|uniref:zinc-binding dehydrogenase n=2 Tax=Dactylosporangium matsuzakiense TaxID=53360 RepID=UPI0021C347E9|nr:alcohol dehydrogenase catalytic domain-containing protein [Dactylosporangium matsuzakiense]UWZ42397.1 alcohol dehydrogenase catalytic domain-containing protein [Dactylosporangium matsuzakiense]